MAKLLGWDANDFHDHFRSDPLYEDWKQDGKEIHVDHIIPLSLYRLDYEDHPDLKKAWDLRNLQFLPAKSNRDKKDSLDWGLIEKLGIFDLLPVGIDVPVGYEMVG